ncbi:unnamed protein product, partial [Gadus morhua 'NCC']
MWFPHRNPALSSVCILLPATGPLTTPGRPSASIRRTGLHQSPGFSQENSPTSPFTHPGAKQPSTTGHQGPR